MENKITSIKIAGIGGMGVLKSSLILAELYFREGYDVKKAEVHGMSQRGGSICSDIRFGEKVYSPMIPDHSVDYLLLFKEDQLPLYKTSCSDATVIIKAESIDISQLKSKKSLNVAMLGILCAQLNGDQEKWISVILEVLPPKLHEANRAAFQLGINSPI